MKVTNLDPSGFRAAGATRGHVARKRAGGSIMARDQTGTRIRIEELVLTGLSLADAGDGTGVVSSGGPSGSTAMVPYYIPPGDGFTVPIYRQAPYALTIVIDGTLIEDGYLVEVD